MSLKSGSMFKKLTMYAMSFGMICSSAAFLPGPSAEAATQATYFVDPVNGLDTNNGTSTTTAFQTIEHARDVVRTINSSMTGDIEVKLRGGTYTLNSTLNLTDTDSGTNGYNIIYSAYNGEVPVISGGKSITGWSLYDSGKNIYRAYAGGDMETRQLFVNGNRAIRARSTGVPSPLTFVKASGYTANGSVYANSTIPMHQWGNPSDIEFVYNIWWTAPRIGVDTITNNGTTTTMTMKQPGWGAVTNKGGTSVGASPPNANGLPMYIENAYELLDTAGEWYLDRSTDYFYYKPRTGEDLSSAEVIAPVLEELVRVQGTDLDHKVSNIQFYGIQFSYATDLRANGNLGIPDAQNNVMRDLVPNPPTPSYRDEVILHAAVNLKYAQSIKFERDVFKYLGGTGLNMYAGTQDSPIIGSTFTDISANGVQVGDYLGLYDVGTENYGQSTDTRTYMRNDDVTNSYFDNIGVEYYASTAIAASLPVDMDITHNEITNTPYSGIHVGWGWGVIQPTIHKNTVISNNFLHETMMVLLDGGAIYSVGSTGGDATHKNIITNNYMLNDYNLFGAVYLDGGTDWWNVDNNVVDNAPKFFVTNSTDTNSSVTNTYTSVAGYDLKTIPVSGTTVVTDGNWPPAAQAIMANAGIESAYQDIRPSIKYSSQRLIENFNSMNAGNAPTGWTVDNADGDGTVSIQGVTSPTDKSMQVTRTGTTSSKALSSSHGFSPVITGTVETKARAEQTNARVLPIVAKSGSTSAVEIAFNSNGNIAYKNASGTWIDVQPYSAGTWYNFKLEFDTVSDTYALYIDSVLKVSDIPFTVPSGAIDAVAYQVPNSSVGTLLIDNINVYEGNTERPIVSLNKPVTYSTQLTTTSWKAANINDGVVNNASRGWASVSGSGTRNEWVMIDLGDTYSISSFTIQNEDSVVGRNAKDYVLYGSLTGDFGGEEFILSSGTLPALSSKQLYSIGFTPGVAQYMKFKATSSYSNYVIVGELTVTGKQVVVPPPPPTPVSLHKMVTGYSTQLNTSSWKATNVTDGVVNSTNRGWASVSGSGTRNEWVTMDLAQTYNLTSFTIQNEDAGDNRNVKDYVLYGSATGAFAGEEFVISSGTIPSLLHMETYSVTFTPVDARYLKFKGTSSYSTYVIVGELSLYGTLVSLPPVSLNKTVTGFSSQLNTTEWKATNINDGTVSTGGTKRGWASVSGSGTRNEWVTIDLGQSYTLTGFSIQNEDAAGRNAKDYILYGSATGAFAGEEFVITSGTAPSLTNLAYYTANFTPASARYVKFKATSSYSSYVIVGELSLYGQ